jgi:signal transduction histidine kinase
LRLKFFFTIFSVLTLTALATSYIHYHFFKLERLRLIEINLQQNASLIADSDLTLSKGEFRSKGQELMDEIIGDDKINMIIVIYAENGNVLYKNQNAEIFEVPDFIPKAFPHWQNFESQDYFIKFLTIQDKTQHRIIKVGMILNQSLLRWKYLNQRISLFVLILLGVITIISFFLTYILFRPVKKLADQVNLMTDKIEKGEFKDLKSWFGIQKKGGNPKDEYQKLISSLDKLAVKIMDHHMLTQKWSALMAHELKTPMTILKNSIEDLTRDLQIEPSRKQNVENELDRLEKIIMDFLEWASVENDPSRPEIHALPLGKTVLRLINTIEDNYPQTSIVFHNNLKAEKRIFCNPLHFDQVLNNLLLNAAKYGGTGAIEVTVNDESLMVQDHGPGIPDEVVENFGKPFNKFNQGNQTGHGLGLAWVSTVARKYEWQISISNQSGTMVKVTFPQHY